MMKRFGIFRNFQPAPIPPPPLPTPATGISTEGSEHDALLEQQLRDVNNKYVKKLVLSTPVKQLADEHNVNILVGTYNVNGRQPPPDTDLEEWFKPDPRTGGSALTEETDMVIAGFQEIVPLSASNVLTGPSPESVNSWDRAVAEALNGKPWAETRFPRGDQPGELAPSIYNIGKQVVSRQASNFLEDLETKWAGGTVRKTDPLPESALTGSLDNSEQEQFVQIAAKQLVGVYLSIWVRKRMLQHVRGIQSISATTGFGGLLGNKGAVAIRMRVYDSALCIVCAHMAAGEGPVNTEKRNADYRMILHKCIFKPDSTGMAEYINAPWRKVATQYIGAALGGHSQWGASDMSIMDHYNIIWLGDLNYRLSLSDDDIRSLIKENRLDRLLEHDQLRKEQSAGNAFQGWAEGEINFQPTFKYKIGTSIYAGDPFSWSYTASESDTESRCDSPVSYQSDLTRDRFLIRSVSADVRMSSEFNTTTSATHVLEQAAQEVATADAKESQKKRSPAWCDRILWVPNRELFLLSYFRSELTASDHRPVSAEFLFKARQYDHKKVGDAIEAALVQRSAMEAAMSPRCDVYPQTIDVGVVGYRERRMFSVNIANTTTVDAIFYFVQQDLTAGVAHKAGKVGPGWLDVKPVEGVVKAGSRQVVSLTLEVRGGPGGTAEELTLSKGRILDTILILRIEDGSDSFISITGTYKGSVYGLSLSTLATLTPPPPSSISVLEDAGLESIADGDLLMHDLSDSASPPQCAAKDSINDLDDFLLRPNNTSADTILAQAALKLMSSPDDETVNSDYVLLSDADPNSPRLAASERAVMDDVWSLDLNKSSPQSRAGAVAEAGPDDDQQDELIAQVVAALQPSLQSQAEAATGGTHQAATTMASLFPLPAPFTPQPGCGPESYINMAHITDTLPADAPMGVPPGLQLGSYGPQSALQLGPSGSQPAQLAEPGRARVLLPAALPLGTPVHQSADAVWERGRAQPLGSLTAGAGEQLSAPGVSVSLSLGTTHWQAFAADTQIADSTTPIVAEQPPQYTAQPLSQQPQLSQYAAQSQRVLQQQQPSEPQWGADQAAQYATQSERGLQQQLSDQSLQYASQPQQQQRVLQQQLSEQLRNVEQSAEYATQILQQQRMLQQQLSDQQRSVEQPAEYATQPLQQQRMLQQLSDQHRSVEQTAEYATQPLQQQRMLQQQLSEQLRSVEQSAEYASQLLQQQRMLQQLSDKQRSEQSAAYTMQPLQQQRMLQQQLSSEQQRSVEQSPEYAMQPLQQQRMLQQQLSEQQRSAEPSPRYALQPPPQQRPQQQPGADAQWSTDQSLQYATQTLPQQRTLQQFLSAQQRSADPPPQPQQTGVQRQRSSQQRTAGQSLQYTDQSLQYTDQSLQYTDQSLQYTDQPLSVQQQSVAPRRSIDQPHVSPNTDALAADALDAFPLAREHSTPATLSTTGTANPPADAVTAWGFDVLASQGQALPAPTDTPAADDMTRDADTGVSTGKRGGVVVQSDTATSQCSTVSTWAYTQPGPTPTSGPPQSLSNDPIVGAMGGQETHISSTSSFGMAVQASEGTNMYPFAPTFLEAGRNTAVGGVSLQYGHPTTAADVPPEYTHFTAASTGEPSAAPTNVGIAAASITMTNIHPATAGIPKPNVTPTDAMPVTDDANPGNQSPPKPTGPLAEPLLRKNLAADGDTDAVVGSPRSTRSSTPEPTSRQVAQTTQPPTDVLADASSDDLAVGLASAILSTMAATSSSKSVTVSEAGISNEPGSTEPDSGKSAPHPAEVARAPVLLSVPPAGTSPRIRRHTDKLISVEVAEITSPPPPALNPECAPTVDDILLGNVPCAAQPEPSTSGQSVKRQALSDPTPFETRLPSLNINRRPTIDDIWTSDTGLRAAVRDQRAPPSSVSSRTPAPAIHSEQSGPSLGLIASTLQHAHLQRPTTEEIWAETLSIDSAPISAHVSDAAVLSNVSSTSVDLQSSRPTIDQIWPDVSAGRQASTVSDGGDSLISTAISAIRVAPYVSQLTGSSHRASPVAGSQENPSSSLTASVDDILLGVAPLAYEPVTPTIASPPFPPSQTLRTAATPPAGITAKQPADVLGPSASSFDAKNAEIRTTIQSSISAPSDPSASTLQLPGSASMPTPTLLAGILQPAAGSITSTGAFVASPFDSGPVEPTRPSAPSTASAGGVVLEQLQAYAQPPTSTSYTAYTPPSADLPADVSASYTPRMQTSASLTLDPTTSYTAHIPTSAGLALDPNTSFTAHIPTSVALSLDPNTSFTAYVPASVGLAPAPGTIYISHAPSSVGLTPDTAIRSSTMIPGPINTQLPFIAHQRAISLPGYLSESPRIAPGESIIGRTSLPSSATFISATPYTDTPMPQPSLPAPTSPLPFTSMAPPGLSSLPQSFLHPSQHPTVSIPQLSHTQPFQLQAASVSSAMTPRMTQLAPTAHLFTSTPPSIAAAEEAEQGTPVLSQQLPLTPVTSVEYHAIPESAAQTSSSLQYSHPAVEATPVYSQPGEQILSPSGVSNTRTLPTTDILSLQQMQMQQHSVLSRLPDAFVTIHTVSHPQMIPPAAQTLPSGTALGVPVMPISMASHMGQMPGMQSGMLPALPEEEFISMMSATALVQLPSPSLHSSADATATPSTLSVNLALPDRAPTPPIPIASLLPLPIQPPPTPTLPAPAATSSFIPSSATPIVNVQAGPSGSPVLSASSQASAPDAFDFLHQVTALQQSSLSPPTEPMHPKLPAINTGTTAKQDIRSSLPLFSEQPKPTHKQKSFSISEVPARASHFSEFQSAAQHNDSPMSALSEPTVVSLPPVSQPLQPPLQPISVPPYLSTSTSSQAGSSEPSAAPSTPTPQFLSLTHDTTHTSGTSIAPAPAAAAAGMVQAGMPPSSSQRSPQHSAQRSPPTSAATATHSRQPTIDDILLGDAVLTPAGTPTQQPATVAPAAMKPALQEPSSAALTSVPLPLEAKVSQAEEQEGSAHSRTAAPSMKPPSSGAVRQAHPARPSASAPSPQPRLPHPGAILPPPTLKPLILPDAHADADAPASRLASKPGTSTPHGSSALSPAMTHGTSTGYATPSTIQGLTPTAKLYNGTDILPLNLIDWDPFDEYFTTIPFPRLKTILHSQGSYRPAELVPPAIKLITSFLLAKKRLHTPGILAKSIETLLRRNTKERHTNQLYVDLMLGQSPATVVQGSQELRFQLCALTENVRKAMDDTRAIPVMTDPHVAATALIMLLLELPEPIFSERVSTIAGKSALSAKTIAPFLAEHLKPTEYACLQHILELLHVALHPLNRCHNGLTKQSVEALLTSCLFEYRFAGLDPQASNMELANIVDNRGRFVSLLLEPVVSSPMHLRATTED